MTYRRTDYHESYADWRNSYNLKGRFIGIELELESKNHRDVCRALPALSNRFRPLVEEDGSLSDEGVELIFPPLRYPSIKRKNSSIHRVMEAVKSLVRTTNTTGMHLNVNTCGWEQKKITRYVMAFHLMAQEDLVKLGGRNLNYYCAQLSSDDVDGYIEWDELTYTIFDDHAWCAEPKGERVELRFPSATTNHLRLCSLIDMARAVEDFVESKLWPKEIEEPEEHFDDDDYPGFHGVEFDKAKRLVSTAWRKFVASRKKYHHLLKIMNEGFLEYEQSVVNPSTPEAAAGQAVGWTPPAARAA